mmetsp:Transcript_26814/g.74948  ORF Transcript_26814/g.74948 Transcript_26814/m.74948 type:complete len:330 (+) Transcript_26814:252-1241(+)
MHWITVFIFVLQFAIGGYTSILDFKQYGLVRKDNFEHRGDADYTGGLRKGEHRQYTKGKTVVVMQVRNINDACRANRFKQLISLTSALGWDVCLQHDDPEIPVWLQREVDRNLKVCTYKKQDNMVLRTQLPAKYAPRAAVANKWMFEMWVSKQDYDYAWYVEDDVYLQGGNWSQFFSRATELGGDADLVGWFRTMKPDWPWGPISRIQGRSLRDDRGGFLQTLIFCFRVSRRFAQESVALEMGGALRGHEEALYAPLCDRYMTNCQRRTLYFPGGYVEPGGGAGAPRGKVSVFELVRYAQSKGYLPDSPRNNENSDILPGHIYHPIKCD